MSFQSLLNKQQLTEQILQVKEGKNMTWEKIAQALYQILNDIDTEDDHCRENNEAFRKLAMQHQARKNQFMASSDRQSVVRVNEARGNWRNWGEVECTKQGCGWVNYTKNYTKEGKSVPTTCPKCGSPTKTTFTTQANECACHIYEMDDDKLQMAGLFDKDSDYEGMLGGAVIDLIEKFAEQGHSGFSAEITAAIFDKLVHWKPLSELTNDPSEWTDITEQHGDHKSLTPTGTDRFYQSKRSPSCFSEDGGLTYYDQDECVDEGKEEDGTTYTMFNPAKILTNIHVAKSKE